MEKIYIENFGCSINFRTIAEQVPANYADITAIVNEEHNRIKILSGYYRSFKTVPGKFVTPFYNYLESDILYWCPVIVTEIKKSF